MCTSNVDCVTVRAAYRHLSQSVNSVGTECAQYQLSFVDNSFNTWHSICSVFLYNYLLKLKKISKNGTTRLVNNFVDLRFFIYRLTRWINFEIKLSTRWKIPIKIWFINVSIQVNVTEKPESEVMFHHFCRRRYNHFHFLSQTLTNESFKILIFLLYQWPDPCMRHLKKQNFPIQSKRLESG